MFGKTSKKVLSTVMAAAMTVNMLPMTAFADETECVYMSVSYDGKYINGANGSPMAYIPVSLDALEAVDLDELGLSEYKYDEDGDGSYETTALQLVIYAHEELYGGDWSDVTFTGAPGSSYFQGGIFGFDENLNYYLNGEYPLAGEGWGATSDQIVLEAGDFIHLASFSSWHFYMDSNYGFHFFADENDAFTHNYTAEAGEALDVKLVRSFSGMGTGATIYDEVDYKIFYGTALYDVTGSVTTDDSGCAEITFPSAGKWYLWADGGYGNEYSDSIVSAPAYAEITVTAKEEPAPETPREPQDVSAVLNATMAQLAATVTEPVFGTTAGEWTVLSLARGGYYAKDNAYFSDYYDRIVETVNETAASVNMNGALHKNKSTENSRLIVALSALGKDATSVGDYDLVEAYSANGFSWIKKQGLNGTIWALIALDSNNYETSDTTIRQQCVDSILSLQHDDGGWSLMANKTYASDPDITGMALTALYPYRDQPAVAEACAEAFACLSEMQHDNGTFASGGSECSESCAWVIVSTTTWGINPDTDSRFIKNGKSVVDGLLAHYKEDEAMFQHIIGAGSNAMATDQSCYALVAYNRFMNNQPALYDYSDVTFDAVTTPENPVNPENPVTEDMTATLTASTDNVAPVVGASFNATVSINKWDNEGGYKLIDFIVSVPKGLSLAETVQEDETILNDAVTVSRLQGGEVHYNLEEQEDGSGKLRVVYFDPNGEMDLTVTDGEFPADLFTIKFKVNEKVSEVPTAEDGNKYFNIALTGMSVKLSSDSSDENAMIIVNTGEAKVSVMLGNGLDAVCLYTGDDVDLIPSNKMAVAIKVSGNYDIGSEEFVAPALTYNDGSYQYAFKYSQAMSEKTGMPTYVALVDAAIQMENFINASCVKLGEIPAQPLTFGDTNFDGTINAQDALAAVDFWLRKVEITSDDQILVTNVNSDSRLNTFDALGIVENFVDGKEYAVVAKAAVLKQEAAPETIPDETVTTPDGTETENA